MKAPEGMKVKKVQAPKDLAQDLVEGELYMNVVKLWPPESKKEPKAELRRGKVMASYEDGVATLIVPGQGCSIAASVRLDELMTVLKAAADTYREKNESEEKKDEV